MKQPKFIPVLFHNLEGYDAHLFIRNLGVSSGDIKCIPKTEEKYISFTKQKGVYPYEYMDGFDKLGKATLPPKSKFFSKLNNADISDADYERGQNVWNVFGMKTMRDYHDLYLKTDVLLLADVMIWKTLGRSAKQTTDWIQCGTTQHPDSLGTLH
jgi:hypothetical protein